MRSMRSIRWLAVSSCLVLFIVMGNFVLASSPSSSIVTSGVIAYENSTTSIKKAFVLWGISGALSNDGSGNWATDKVGWCAKFDLVSLHPEVTNVAAIKARNPKTKVIAYKDAVGMEESVEDWAEVDAHEDWFMHDIYGNTREHRLQTTDAPWVFWLMDPTSGWRDHYVDRINHYISAHNYDGVFMDDCWIYLFDDWFPNPSIIPERPNWYNEMKDFIAHVKSHIGRNLVIFNNGDTNYLAAGDGRTEENFEVRKWYTSKGWIDLLSKESSTGKIVVAWPHYTQGSSIADDPAIFKFTFCCALLGMNGPNTYFGWTDGWHAPHYGYYQEMDINLGEPLGPYQISSSNGQYFRDFQNFRVVVDMTARTGQLLPRG